MLCCSGILSTLWTYQSYPFKVQQFFSMSLTIQLQKKLEPVVSWEDITCLLWHNGMLFSTVTSSYVTSTECNGKVNVWDKDLNSLGEFKAHNYGIYHMCSGPGDTIYTCAADSTICHWQCLSASSCSSSSTPETEKFKRLSLLEGHLEPAWKMQFFNNKLFSADWWGEIRLWENDCYKGVMETYEEVWDMIVIPKLIFTVRNHDITITSFPDDGLKKACSVKNMVPGRSPLFVAGNKIICHSRTNFDIMVYSINEEGNPLIKVLNGHEMLVNAFVGNEDIMFSGGYEGKILVWDLKELQKCAEICLKENGCINAMAYEPSDRAIFVAQENKSLTKLVFK